MKEYSSKKKAKKAAKKEPGGLYKNRSEQHKKGGLHFHDKDHTNPDKPNTHYEY